MSPRHRQPNTAMQQQCARTKLPCTWQAPVQEDQGLTMVHVYMYSTCTRLGSCTAGEWRRGNHSRHALDKSGRHFWSGRHSQPLLLAKVAASTHTPPLMTHRAARIWPALPAGSEPHPAGHLLAVRLSCALVGHVANGSHHECAHIYLLLEVAR